MIDRPHYVNEILKYVNTPLVKILTGVRRSGKSTILKLLIEALKSRGISGSRIFLYNFDSLENEELLSAKALYAHVINRLPAEGKAYLFFDEIQEVAAWEKAINSLMTVCNVDIYVTGSNSRMMSSEISTYLTGRYISFRVYTLSFREYLAFRQSYTQIDNPRAELARYLRFGGFPAINLREYAQDEAYAIVRDILNATVFSDIVRRNQIRKVDLLERIVRFMLDNTGRTFSAATISKYIIKSENRTIDNETVYSYLNKLESAYILSRCMRYDVQGKELLKTQEKYYIADTSLRYSVLGYSQDSVAAMLENIVYLELRRRGYDVYVGKYDASEIDFVAVRRENKLYVQVAQEISRGDTERREYSKLLCIHDNYPKYVLSTDDFAGGNYEGIRSMHIADFLLSDEY